MYDIYVTKHKKNQQHTYLNNINKKRNQIIALITNVSDRYIYQTFHAELQDSVHSFHVKVKVVSIMF